jgi:glycosyltransferase involved in cell wall biosynthesis
MTDLSSSIAYSSSPNSHKRIWILNPFDQLPNETDVPLRYWTLCKVLAELGHEVIWWSSDFSHLTKSTRAPCPPTDGFSVRLIETPAYYKNVGLARIKNHNQFAEGFYQAAMDALNSRSLKAPDRMVVSLPPLGIAQQAFAIRDFINKTLKSSTEIEHSSGRTRASCEVIVDIMDAWPETFYQVLPNPLRKSVGPVLLAPMHKSAKQAYSGADKISAVGESYLELARTYLRNQKGKGGHSRNTDHTDRQRVPSKSARTTPMMLCYHGTELDRFTPNRTTTIAAQDLTAGPLRAVYLGSIGRGYDLETAIRVAARWKGENRFPFQIHFAGVGADYDRLRSLAQQLDLLGTHEKDESAVPANARQAQDFEIPRLVFHGLLKKDAVNELLGSSHVALVANRPDSLVACPYKAGEYAAAGLPMISCLSGELNQLISQWNAGTEYTEGDVDSLQAAFETYLEVPDLLQQQQQGAIKLAKALFDRRVSYRSLAAFILSTDR